MRTATAIHASLLSVLFVYACTMPSTQSQQPTEPQAIKATVDNPLVDESALRSTTWTPQPANQRRADRFADVELLTQDGETVKFLSDLVRDRAVLLNFMYTNCSGI
jgi:cytochrome oxidase Cu insertion factor (SCO1/SenC/PrrC family)